jgi:hypothetical protein
MKRWALVFLLFCAAISLRAQVVESASVRPFTVSAGGTGSFFKPGAAGGNYLIGGGTYADFRFSQWVQIEGEARWLRFGDLDGEEQSHYLIGPKIPLHQFGRAGLYGKAMIGLGRMTLPQPGFEAKCTCTTLSFGGGLDYKLSRKLTLRAVDFEYQHWFWPDSVVDETIHPYGVSVGMAYRVF